MKPDPTPDTPQKADLRTRQCSFFLTDQDARELGGFSRRAGFTSTAQMMTAIAERLMLGGFSPAVFFKVGMQLRDFAQKNGAIFDRGFYFGTRPLPALPDEHISDVQLKKEIATLRRELFTSEHQTTPTKPA